MKIAVVGTAGRDKRFESYHSLRLFEKMVETIAEKVSPDAVLVSGGAAWADHVAVALFLQGKVAGLRLHLPCQWDSLRSQHLDTGDSHWAKNPGKMANLCHDKFSKIIGRWSLSEIAMARDRGAIITTSKGFHARNTVIARECDYNISMTWAAGDAPTDGGTLDTWRKCTKPKEHISLLSLIKKPDKRKRCDDDA